MKLKLVLLINSMMVFAASAMQPQSVAVPLQNHSKSITSVVFLPNNRIASGSTDTTVVITDLNSQKMLQKLTDLGGVTSLAVNSTHNLLDIGSASQSMPLFYNYQNNAFVYGKPADQKAKPEGVSAITVVDPLTIATGHFNGYVIVTMAKGVGQGGGMRPYQIGQPINSITHSGVEKILATSAKTNVIYMINARTGQVSQIPLQAAPRSIAVLGTARWAVGLMDGRIHILEFIGGKNVLKELKGHTDAVKALSAINEKYLVSGSADGSVKVWNVQTAQEVATLNPTQANQGAVNAVASESQGNGANIAAGYENGSVSVWKNISLSN